MMTKTQIMTVGAVALGLWWLLRQEADAKEVSIAPGARYEMTLPARQFLGAPDSATNQWHVRSILGTQVELFSADLNMAITTSKQNLSKLIDAGTAIPAGKLSLI